MAQKLFKKLANVWLSYKIKIMKKSQKPVVSNHLKMSEHSGTWEQQWKMKIRFVIRLGYE
jgi:hypothetical protein